MLIAKLKLLKEKSGLGSKEIAERSGVGLRTVQRIFSGETENPSFQDIADIVMAMGGSLDALVGIEHPDNQTPNLVLELYERSLARKNKYINMLIILCLVILSILLLFLIYDVLHEDVGYLKF